MGRVPSHEPGYQVASGALDRIRDLCFREGIELASMNTPHVLETCINWYSGTWVLTRLHKVSELGKGLSSSAPPQTSSPVDRHASS